MPETVKIGNAQGFWGDSPGAAAELLSQQPDLDYITLDYLAEVSMSIMAIQKEKKPEAGYAKDFVDVVKSLLPFWEKGSQVKIVTNAGGLNPLGCANACQVLLKHSKASHLKIGVVYGDDVLQALILQPKHPLYCSMETGESLEAVKDRLATANAYLGAKPIADLLSSGADIVITGRVADPSLTVAPCAAHFRWDFTQYDLIAQATIAGHLIECGTQVTGGITTHWLDIADKVNIGFPFVEVESDGSFALTKPTGSGGIVDIETVKEQLLYEIGDPSAYLSPDATVSFLSLRLEQVGDNRVRIMGAKGSPPPATYKVSATYRDGYKAEAFLAIVGPEAAKKGRLCGEIILQKVRKAGFDLQRSVVECFGNGALSGGILSSEQDAECILRVAAADSRYAALKQFGKEIAPMVTCGPQGVTGYASGRPNIRQVFGYWPCLIEREHVNFKTAMV